MGGTDAETTISQINPARFGYRVLGTGVYPVIPGRIAFSRRC
ncbi:MAG: hypothetical protein ACI9OD_002857, partial [Limisphaerales bacterium]